MTKAKWEREKILAQRVVIQFNFELVERKRGGITFLRPGSSLNGGVIGGRISSTTATAAATAAAAAVAAAGGASSGSDEVTGQAV